MLIKTPAQIKKFLADNMHKFDTPEAYLGDEPNARRWSQEQWKGAKLRTLLLSPFDYLQGMGNTTIPLLYQLANDHNSETHITERCYVPTSHREVTLFERNGIPPFGLETRHSLPEFDLIAATLSYPGYWFNIVKMLKWAGVPVRWKDRVDMKEPYPLIMAGGHIFASPWSIAPTIDILFCGEAEDESKEAAAKVAPEKIHDIKALGAAYDELSENPGWNAVRDDLEWYKTNGMYYTADGREKMLYELAKRYSFLFIPRFYSVRWKGDGARQECGHPHIDGFDKKYPDLPDKIRKRFVRNLDEAPVLTHPIVPFNDPGWVGTVQIAKGCSYRCGFCAASYREAPYRERSQNVMYGAFREVMLQTGAAQVSPLVLEFGTYSRKKALMKQVLEGLTDEFSMPSLRIDVFGRDPAFGQLAVVGQKKNVTIAIEGNSQKMREVISKGITADDVLKSIANAIAAGYESAKLYMITDLPGETEADVREIVELCDRIDQLRKSVGSKMKIRLSWKPLTIQAHTPLQWFPTRTFSGALGQAMKDIQKFGFGTQLGDETRSSLGNFLQIAELADDVGGEILLDTILDSDAITYGALSRRVYDHLKVNMAKHGRVFDDYYRGKHEDEIFAWDIIDTRVSKSYLLRHYQAARARAYDEPEAQIYGSGFIEKFGGCQMGCTQCGACQDGEGEDNKMFIQMENFAGRVDLPVKAFDIKKIDRKSQAQRLLLTIEVDPAKRYVSKLHWTFVLRRACYQVGINIATDSIRYTTDRVKTLKPWFAGREFVEMALVTPEPDVEGIAARLNEHTKNFGYNILRTDQLLLSQKLATKRIDGVLWELEIDRPMVDLREAVAKWETGEYTKLTYKTNSYRQGEVVTTVDLKDVMHDAWVHVQGTAVRLVMILDSTISPYDAANAIIGHRTDVFRYSANMKYAMTELDRTASNAFIPDCQICQLKIPLEFDEPIDPHICPKCQYLVSPSKIKAVRDHIAKAEADAVRKLTPA